MNLKDLVSIIENMTDDAQMYLKNALLEILYRKKDPLKLKPSDNLQAVLDAGILQTVDGGYTIAPTAKKKIRKLYTYLIRKFDTEEYYDPDKNEMVPIPKGSEFVCTITPADGTSKLTLQFPADEVTALLDLFGTNPCDKWTAK